MRAIPSPDPGGNSSTTIGWSLWSTNRTASRDAPSAAPLPPPDRPTSARNRFSDAGAPTVGGSITFGSIVATARAQVAPSTAHGPARRARAKVNRCSSTGRCVQNAAAVGSSTTVAGLTLGCPLPQAASFFACWTASVPACRSRGNRSHSGAQEAASTNAFPISAKRCR